jgi:hypothetical protein
MAFPLGVPSPIDIAEQAKKVYEFYRKARDRRRSVTAANLLLDSLNVAFEGVESPALRVVALDDCSIAAQVSTARKLWCEAKEMLAGFEAGENDDIAHRRYKDVKWALRDLDEKLSRSWQHISLVFATIPVAQLAALRYVLVALHGPS